jgi:hypothetical protein
MQTQGERLFKVLCAAVSAAWGVSVVMYHGNDTPSTLGLMPYMATCVSAAVSILCAIVLLDRATRESSPESQEPVE